MLSEIHKKAFQSECSVLSQAVLGSLLKLAENPKDQEELSKLIQSADTIMGNARFIQDEKLEQSSTMIVKSFKGIKDVREKINEFSAAYEQFSLMINHAGACPKGYVLVDGKCVLDNSRTIERIVKSKINIKNFKNS